MRVRGFFSARSWSAPAIVPGLAGAVVGALVIGLGMPAAVDGGGSADSPRPTQGTSAETDLTEGTAVGGTDHGAAQEQPASAPSATTGGATPTPGSVAAGTDAAWAGEVGVTEDAITVGFLLLDIGGASRFGASFPGAEPESQRRSFQSFVDELNERGGVHGRKVVPRYRTFNVLDQDDIRAACIELTRDARSFAVLAMPGYRGGGNLCVTKENGTPLLAGASGVVTTDWIEEANGLLFIQSQHSTRMMFNWVAEVHDSRLLAERTIGVLDDAEYSHYGTDQGLLPALADAGYEVARHVRLSADLATAASQVPLAVQQMRSAGVDTVLLNTNFQNDTTFVQTADAQGWRPRYLLSDWEGLTNDGVVENMPESFDGAIAITSYRTGEWRTGAPEPETERSCRLVHERQSGERLSWQGSGAAYNLTMTACGLMQLFEQGAAGAGAALSRARFTGALHALGPVPQAGLLAASLAPGRFDLPDAVRPIRWSADCRCWQIAGPARRTRH